MDRIELSYKNKDVTQRNNKTGADEGRTIVFQSSEKTPDVKITISCPPKMFPISDLIDSIEIVFKGEQTTIDDYVPGDDL